MIARLETNIRHLPASKGDGGAVLGDRGGRARGCAIRLKVDTYLEEADARQA